MALYRRQGLITELLDRIELVRAGSQPFLRLSDEQLGFTPAPGTWSVAEIFDHLNRSNEIYIRHILSRIAVAPDTTTEEFRSSWLGEMAYERIVPRPDGSVLKMKTAKSVTPIKPTEELRETLHSFHRT